MLAESWVVLVKYSALWYIVTPEKYCRQYKVYTFSKLATTLEIYVDQIVSIKSLY